VKVKKLSGIQAVRVIGDREKRVGLSEKRRADIPYHERPGKSQGLPGRFTIRIGGGEAGTASRKKRDASLGEKAIGKKEYISGTR